MLSNDRAALSTASVAKSTQLLNPRNQVKTVPRLDKQQNQNVILITALIARNAVLGSLCLCEGVLEAMLVFCVTLANFRSLKHHFLLSWLLDEITPA
jgi:hypothetical protein